MLSGEPENRQGRRSNTQSECAQYDYFLYEKKSIQICDKKKKRKTATIAWILMKDNVILNWPSSKTSEG